MPGGADPDDHWFPPILQDVPVPRTVRIHQLQKIGLYWLELLLTVDC